MGQITTLAVLCATLILQAINARKYWSTNGANTTRVILILTNLSFMTHTIRLIFDFNSGYFFTLGIFFLFYLYAQRWIREKLKI